MRVDDHIRGGQRGRWLPVPVRSGGYMFHDENWESCVRGQTYASRRMLKGLDLLAYVAIQIH